MEKDQDKQSFSDLLKILAKGRKVTLKRSYSGSFTTEEKRARYSPQEADSELLVPDLEMDYKHFSPQDLLSEADHYYNLPTPDLIKTSSFLWRAAVCSVKALYLANRINIISRNALRRFCSYASIASTLPAYVTCQMSEGLRKAEEMHYYSYGYDFWPKRTFNQYKEEVVQFVNNFKKIQPKIVALELDTFLESQTDFEVRKVKERWVTMGKVEYTYDIICC